MTSWLVILAGYLLGCIPTAYMAGRLLKSEDIRRMGDHNSGAANAYHELGAGVGIIVGILDAGKGILAIIVAEVGGVSQMVIMFTGIAAVVGHNWPVFIGFRGGRGESTAIGVLLTLITLPLLTLAAPALLVLFFKKNVIAASAVLFAPLSLVAWWMGTSGPLIAYSIALPCLVGFTHFIRTRPKPVHEVGTPDAD